jgi:hypothetical protein
MAMTLKRRYDMLIRVRNFGTNYGQLFPESSLARQAFADLSAAIDQVQAQQVAERTATASAAATRTASAREALNERLVKIAATARVISETNGDLGGLFQVVDATSDQQLLTTGHGFVKNAEPFTAAFVAHGMPPTFVTDLQASIEAFDRALRDRGTGRNEQTAARAGIRTAMAAARAALRKLDVIVANHTGLEASVREVWERERRVSPPRAHGKSGAPSVEEQPPAPAVEEKAA